MKMIEQHVTHTHSCKPAEYLNLSIVSLQMYSSTILEQKVNDISYHNNQNVFETCFALVFFNMSTHWPYKYRHSRTISVTVLLIVVLLFKFSVVRFVCV